jgi:hypothetical protein
MVRGKGLYLGQDVTKLKEIAGQPGAPPIVSVLASMAGFAGGVYLATKIIKRSSQSAAYEGEQATDSCGRDSPGRSSLCSHSGRTEAAIPIAAMLPTCSCFQFSTCSCCLRRSWPTIAATHPSTPASSRVERQPMWSRSFAVTFTRRTNRAPKNLLDGPHGLIACEAVPVACGRARPPDRVQVCDGSPHRHCCCRLGACAQCHD